MRSLSTTYVFILIIALLLSACGTSQSVAPSVTPAPTDTRSPTSTSTATQVPETPTPTQTQAPTLTSTSTSVPTPVGSGMGRIAFRKRAKTSTEGKFIDNIHLVNVDGSGLTNLTNNDRTEINILSPQWSPNGDQILLEMIYRDVFEWQGNLLASFKLFTIDPDGNGSEQVPPPISPDGGELDENQLSESDGSWSPDGDSIVFSSNRNNYGTSQNNHELFLYNPGDNELTQLTDRRNTEIWDIFPTWSPDGQKVAFVATNFDVGDAIHIMNIDANVNETTQLTDEIKAEDVNSGSIFSLTWAPDGQKIAFVSQLDGDEELYIVNVDGTGLQQLTQNTSVDRYPQWSPDGSQISFQSDRDGNFELYTIAVNGLAETRLTENPAFDGVAVWSPDGQWIAFSSDRDGDMDIFVMKLDGSEIYNLTHGDGLADQTPSWSP